MTRIPAIQASTRRRWARVLMTTLTSGALLALSAAQVLASYKYPGR